MKLNRTWAMVVAIVMALTLSLSGTLAYLSDTDSDVNVMTLGNVYIEQIEQERDANGNLVDFTQAKPAYPAVGPIKYIDTPVTINGADVLLFVDDLKNVVDKFVTVKNTGKSDAYVRTIVAIEAPDYDPNDLIHINYNNDEYTISNPVTAEIKGVEYVIFTFTLKEILEAGEVSAPSLMQLFLDSKTTNEDCAKFGDAWEVLVVSQAVQAAGFENAKDALDTAFGEISATNHPWTEGVEPVVVFVSSDEELNAALEDATVSEIVLNSGNYGVIDVRVNRTLTISAAADADVKIAGVNGQTNNNNTNLTIKGVTIDNSKQTEGWFTGTAQNIKPCVGVWGGDYTFEDCVFRVTGASGAETGVMSWWTTNHGVMNFKNCTFNGDDNNARGMQIYGNYDLNVEGCTFNTAKDYSIKYVGSEGCAAVLKNNKVYNTTNFVQLGSAAYPGSNYSITFEGNTLAAGINHVYIENAENQTITINGVVKPAIDEEIY